jgi:uncharacterized protein YjbI with pentapeptide repeats
MLDNENYDKRFEKLNEKDLSGKLFENCQFIKCKFIGTDVSNASFINCTFDESELTMCKTANSKFNEVFFVASKIVGMDLSLINKQFVGMSFSKCVLKHCNFSNLSIPKTKFIKSDIDGCDFLDCDLKESKFSDCDFRDCTFQNTDLRKASFKKSIGFTINPSLNKVFGAEFDYPGVLGLVKDFGIKLN